MRRSFYVAAAALVAGGILTPAAQAQQTGRVSAVDAFSVVLVVGDTKAGAPTDVVPPAVSKALADVKDFLPYRNYRLLDSALIRASDSARATSRLRGVDEQTYEIDLRTSPRGASAIDVRFALNDGTVSAQSPSWYDSNTQLTELAQVQAQLASAEDELRNAAKRSGSDADHVVQLQRRIAGLKERVAALDERTRTPGRNVIDTSFTMDVGETVVVGTSKLRGDKGVIVLLTAVPRKK